MHKVLFIVALLLAGGVAAPAFAQTRSLYLGVSGADVTATQQTLIRLGYLAQGKATGYFGPLTQAAVQKFQCDRDVICEGASEPGYGNVGPRTRAALAAAGAAATNPTTAIGARLTPPATGAFEFSGWLPYWRSASSTKDTQPHLSQLKSVMPFTYTMTSDGYINDAGKMAAEPWVSFIAEAKRQKVRVIPTIMWGDGEATHRILSNPATRTRLVNDIVALVNANGFDGIDIDFEAKQHQTITHYSAFHKELYAKMGQKWVYCTVESRMPMEDRYLPGETVPPDAADRANDFVELNKYCDRVAIMAYDQGTVARRLNAARIAPYSPVADPAWVESLILLAAQSIDRNKLVLGIPSYGYEYKVTPLGANQYKYQRLWAFNPGYAADIALKLGILPERTSAGELGFTYDPNDPRLINVKSDATQTQQQHLPTDSITPNAGGTGTATQPFNYVTWSDQRAIADKVALARKYGLRGVAVFKFDYGEDPGMWNVLK